MWQELAAIVVGVIFVSFIYIVLTPLWNEGAEAGNTIIGMGNVSQAGYDTLIGLRYLWDSMIIIVPVGLAVGLIAAAIVRSRWA